jgi:hypothetical protein
MAPDLSSRTEKKWQMVGVDLRHVSYEVVNQYKGTSIHISPIRPSLAERAAAGCLTPRLGYAREILVQEIPNQQFR